MNAQLRTMETLQRELVCASICSCFISESQSHRPRSGTAQDSAPRRWRYTILRGCQEQVWCEERLKGFSRIRWSSKVSFSQEDTYFHQASLWLRSLARLWCLCWSYPGIDGHSYLSLVSQSTSWLLCIPSCEHINRSHGYVKRGRPNAWIARIRSSEAYHQGRQNIGNHTLFVLPFALVHYYSTGRGDSLRVEAPFLLRRRRSTSSAQFLMS